MNSGFIVAGHSAKTAKFQPTGNRPPVPASITRQANNPARVRTDQCFSTSNEPGPESGNTGGNISPDFRAMFADLLAADGFSPDDVRRTISVLQACEAVMDHAGTTQATGTR